MKKPTNTLAKLLDEQQHTNELLSRLVDLLTPDELPPVPDPLPDFPLPEDDHVMYFIEAYPHSYDNIEEYTTEKGYDFDTYLAQIAYLAYHLDQGALRDGQPLRDKYDLVSGPITSIKKVYEAGYPRPMRDSTLSRRYHAARELIE